ncbi:MAG TPA: glycosyltransferase family 2 protein [Patescibacteria group bacterium]|nr:glycosyltransferase family 2 protein [Patescibacteria group bacterium]
MVDINTVIVNWKMKEDIDKCLASFFNDLGESRLKVVVHVVDNSQNQDGIKELLDEKYPQVKYIDAGGNVGFGRAQNLGLKRQEANFYLSLNPDCEFPVGERVLERMVEFLEADPEIGMAGPKLLNSDGGLQYSCYRFPAFLDQIGRRLGWDKRSKRFRQKVDHYLMKDFDHRSDVPVDWLMGSFIFVKMEVVNKIGFFDDRFFMYFEDCDWCRRVWRAGWKVYYVHNIQVKHGHRRGSAQDRAWKSILTNPITRIHIKSWLKYFGKWGLRKEHRGV